jgi:ABC-2 type transport system ATP-binding protein
VDTIVTLKARGEHEALAAALRAELPFVTRTREIAGGVELHVRDADRLVPSVVNAAEGAGFEIVDLAVAEPSLETVFINLTGKDLRE